MANYRLDLKKKTLQRLSICIFALFLVAGAISLIVYFATRPSEAPDDTLPNVTVSITTWNILAPMWTDREYLARRGIVDLNLLDENIRLMLIAGRMKTQRADILHLQEVQANVFERIREHLYPDFLPVAFAPNQNEYWSEFLKQNQTYQENGVATFYNSAVFESVSYRMIELTSDGSIALLSILRLKKSDGIDADTIVSVNCHLQTGFHDDNSSTRVRQTEKIMEEVDELVSSNFSGISKPIVIIAGDMNSQDPLPAYLNVRSHGYLDAVQEVTNRTDIPTFYYDHLIPKSETEAVDWSTLDHVFIRGKDVDSGKVDVISADTPNISSNETSEEQYLSNLNRILSGMKGSKRTEAMKILESEAYKALTDHAHESNDHKVNRVLRLGSDHLPTTVTFHLAQKQKP